MTLDEAKVRLNACVREVLNDRMFEDAEVYWMDGEEEVAAGYFGREVREVAIGAARFLDDEADELRSCGKRGRVEQNAGAGAPVVHPDFDPRDTGYCDFDDEESGT